MLSSKETLQSDHAYTSVVSRLTPPPLAGANFTSQLPTPEVVFISICAWCTRGSIISDLPPDLPLGLQVPPNGALRPRGSSRLCRIRQ